VGVQSQRVNVKKPARNVLGALPVPLTSRIGSGGNKRIVTLSVVGGRVVSDVI
jgi:hypothetical protein